LRLRNAAVPATPDVMALQEVGLVHLVASEDGDATFALTGDGKALLRVLGAEATCGASLAYKKGPLKSRWQVTMARGAQR
jgi:hypothetical protein